MVAQFLALRYGRLPRSLKHSSTFIRSSVASLFTQRGGHNLLKGVAIPLPCTIFKLDKTNFLCSSFPRYPPHGDDEIIELPFHFAIGKA